MVLWQDKVAGQHKHRLLWELSYVQVVVTHEIYSTPVVRRTENNLCSFSEPHILSHFTLVLPIRKKLKDTTLIYNTYWNTALSQRSCVPNCEGPLREYQYNTTRAALLRKHGCFHPPARHDWKRWDQQGAQLGSPGDAHFLLQTATCSDRDATGSSAHVTAWSKSAWCNSAVQREECTFLSMCIAIMIY